MRKFTRKRFWLFALVASTALLGLGPALKADTLTLTLDSSVFNDAPGQTFVVSGTLTQSVPDTLTLFGCQLGLTPPSPPVTFLLLLCPGGLPPTSNALTLFSGPIGSFQLSSSATIGSTGQGFAEFVALDKSTDTFLDTGPVPFTVNVVSTVPEPSSLALLGTGLIGLLGAARRRLVH